MNPKNDREENLLKTLMVISALINHISYECESRSYTLCDDEMDTIFYCRDLADKTLKDYHEP